MQPRTFGTASKPLDLPILGYSEIQRAVGICGAPQFKDAARSEELEFTSRHFSS